MNGRLLSVTVANYRCIESATLEPSGDITVLIGANGSGKTAFLDGVGLVADLITEAQSANQGEARGAIGVPTVAPRDVARDPEQPVRVVLEFEAGGARWRYSVELGCEYERWAVNREALDEVMPTARVVLEHDREGARALRTTKDAETLVPESPNLFELLVGRLTDKKLYRHIRPAVEWLCGITLLRPIPALMRQPLGIGRRPDRYGRDLAARVDRMISTQPKKVEAWLDNTMRDHVGWDDVRIDVERGRRVEFQEHALGRWISLAQASDASILQLYTGILGWSPPEPPPSLYLLDEVAGHHLPRSGSLLADNLRKMATQGRLIITTQSPALVDEVATLGDVWMLRRRPGQSARLTPVAADIGIEAAVSDLGVGIAAFDRLSSMPLCVDE